MKRQKVPVNHGSQKTRKQKDDTRHLDFLYKDQHAYILLTEELNAILNTPKLSMCVFNIIIDDKTLNKLSVGDILEKYENFTPRQLAKIKKYIHIHLDDDNSLFVSDLIDCANNNNIESFAIFDFCIRIIKHKRSAPIVMSAIVYVFEHMRIPQSVLVVPVFEHVINNKTYYQDCQIIAAFCLFRITMNPQYLRIIRDFVTLDKDLHTVLMNKMLHMDYNYDKNCFFYRKYDFTSDADA